MLKMLITLFCFIYTVSFAEEYKVSLLEPERLTTVQCNVVAINDKGQVLGEYQEDQSHAKIYIYDPKNGLTVIESTNNGIQPITLNLISRKNCN